MPHTLEASLAQTAFPPEGGETECRIEIDPDARQNQPLPLHIVFCVDASGSMSGRKIKQAKEGINEAMDGLGSRDEFAVVSFNTSANVVLNPTSGSQVSQTDISSISASGGTHIINGLEKSRELLENMGSGQGGIFTGSSNDQSAVKWIALVTDGRPGSVGSPLSNLVSVISGSNVSGKVAKHQKVAEALNDRGITVHTAGVGSDYGEDIIEAISARSGGKWEHYSSGSGIGTFFQNKIQSARNVVATNPTLKFEPRNGATVDDIRRTVPQIAEVEYEKHRSEYVITDFPDIRKDLTPEYIFSLDIPQHEIDPDVTMADVTLEIGNDTLGETVSVEYALDDEMADEMDTGIKKVEKEAEKADTYLGRKESYDKGTREEKANEIARKKE